MVSRMMPRKLISRSVAAIVGYSSVYSLDSDKFQQPTLPMLDYPYYKPLIVYTLYLETLHKYYKFVRHIKQHVTVM